MKKRGFGIITAIVLLVLIATVGAMIISIATMNSKKATDDYLRVQAEMLARSATEFAVMRIQGFNRTASNNCLETVTIDANPFTAKATINYLFNAATAGALACGNELATNVQDPDLNGMAIIDVVVTTKDGTTTEPIRIHKRTLQKP
ncbi:MAG TPA: type II secretion system protein [Campylobacterales bacterium]|nr:type II secretion system protein [Campylobacterales bacterium]